ncbi:MAG: hypothetical protein ABFS86_07355 [Planctomycetota bacterium]
MDTNDREALARAFGYPYGVPGFSYLFEDGVVAPVDGADFGGRTPVLAYGSNASPDQLIRKFGDLSGVTIPVTRAAVADVDVVYAALFAHYGSVPATIHDSPGTTAFVHVTWLTAEQLDRMHASEGAGSVYLYGRLSGDRVTWSDAPPAGEVSVYVAAAGAVGPEPIALESIPAKGRVFEAVGQAEMLRLARDRLAPGTALEAFMLDTIRDPALRGERSAALAAEAVPMALEGFTPLGA